MDMSIIIPTFNRCSLLKNALKTLQIQECEGKKKIIVVIDGCTDGTLDMLNAEFPEINRVIFSSNVGAAVGLNAGAQVAKGEILLFLDDDMQYRPGLLLAHQRMHQYGKYDVVIGHFPLGDLPAPSFFRNVIYEWTEDWQNHFKENVSFYDALCSGHFSIQRELYEKVGGFDEKFSKWGRKDSELGFRLIKNGANFGFCKEAQAVQNYEKSPSRFLSDFELLGKADVDLYQKHPEIKKNLLLSCYHQAPWIVLFVRRLLNKNPYLIEIFNPLLDDYFDQKYEKGVEDKFLEGLLWIAADFRYWQGVKKRWNNKDLLRQVGNPVSILLYHRIAEDGNRFSVSLEVFKKQMTYLQENRYTILPLSNVVNAFYENRTLPPRSAIITFDDGYKDFLEAWKVLKEFNFPVTLFLSTAFLGGVNNWNTKSMLNNLPMLSHENVLQLISEGVDIQAHSHEHKSFMRISDEEIEQEIIENKKVLEAFGISANFFAYPNGEFTDVARVLLKRHGFQAAFTCISTLSSIDSDLMTFPRITIENCDMLDFEMRLEYGIGLKYAQEELLDHIRTFRPAKYWHAAPDIDPNKIFVYQTKRPSQKSTEGKPEIK